MNMYNMLCGQNPHSDLLLNILGLTKDDFGRFRDVYVEDNIIGVVTRCGGGNREGYQEVFDKMQKHPLFIEDKDDDFDNTYCTFIFRFPDELIKRRQEND